MVQTRRQAARADGTTPSPTSSQTSHASSSTTATSLSEQQANSDNGNNTAPSEVSQEPKLPPSQELLSDPLEAQETRDSQLTSYMDIDTIPETPYADEIEDGSSPEPVAKPSRLEIEIESWNFVAAWKWKTKQDDCGICRMPFEAACPDCRFPGDDCPIMSGACGHAFHMHCITKWITSQSSLNKCPMCRRDFMDMPAPPPQPYEPMMPDDVAENALIELL